MKPFDLEATKRGEPIRTRSDYPAFFIAHVPRVHEDSRVVVRIDKEIVLFHENGSLTGYQKHPSDLLMAEGVSDD